MVIENLEYRADVGRGQARSHRAAKAQSASSGSSVVRSFGAPTWGDYSSPTSADFSVKSLSLTSQILDQHNTIQDTLYHDPSQNYTAGIQRSQGLQDGFRSLGVDLPSTFLQNETQGYYQHDGTSSSVAPQQQVTASNFHDWHNNPTFGWKSVNQPASEQSPSEHISLPAPPQISNRPPVVCQTHSSITTHAPSSDRSYSTQYLAPSAAFSEMDVLRSAHDEVGINQPSLVHSTTDLDGIGSQFSSSGAYDYPDYELEASD